MDVNEFRQRIARGEQMTATNDLGAFMHARAVEVRRACRIINAQPLDDDTLRERIGLLLGEPIDPTTTILSPVVFDAGLNVHFGARVFVNADCKFQDQGGIWIGDGTLIGEGSGAHDDWGYDSVPEVPTGHATSPDSERLPPTDWDKVYEDRRMRQRLKDRRIERELERGFKRPRFRVER